MRTSYRRRRRLRIRRRNRRRTFAKRIKGYRIARGGVRL